MRQRYSSEVGSYVLELAGVVMGVAVFIVGAADISRIFQARSAVRAAVNDGARCLFPTDAACVERGEGELSAPNRTYDVWVWGSGYEVPQESFVVSARWRDEPMYEVSALQDQVEAVTVERVPFQYRPYAMRYPITAHTTYLLQTRYLPVVVGGRPLDPLFADPMTTRVSRPNATHSLQGVRGSTTRRVTSASRTPYNETFKIGSVTFSVRDAWPTMEEDKKQIALMPTPVANSLSCLSGARQLSSSGETLNWSAGTHQACRYRVSSPRSTPVMRDGSFKVPMMFRVEGDSRGTAEDGEGKVMMALSWQSPSAGGGRFELGGRALKYWAGGNFIPRGLAEIDINAGLRSQYGDYKEELSLYHELPLLPVDATVTLEFYLVSFNDRRVAWNGGKLEVWLPQYRLVHERGDCGYASDSSTCSHPPPSAPVHYLSVNDGVPFAAVVTGDDSCSLDSDPSADVDLSSVIARLQGEFVRTGSAYPHSFKLQVPTVGSVCAPQVSTAPCSAELPEYLEGCESSIALDMVASRCGVFGPSRNVIAYSKRALARSAKRIRVCSDGDVPRCALSNARSVGSALYEGAAACEAARISNAPQMVVGPLDATTCHAPEVDAQRLYRSQQKIPVDVPISVVRLPTHSRFSEAPPTSSCVPYRSADGSGREMLCGRGLSEAAAERCCAASGGRCRKQTVVAPSDPSGDNARDQILSAAQRRVVHAVQAGYPPARPQRVCGDSEPNCLEVATALADNDSKAVVSAKVHVPLTLLRPFPSEVTTVEHSTTRELERVG